MIRRDESELIGLAHRITTCGYDASDSNALTIREHSTLYGMLKRWPQCERRRQSGAWDGVERRKSRMGAA